MKPPSPRSPPAPDLRWSMPSLSLVEGWYAPVGRTDLWLPTSCPGQADQTDDAGWCRKTLGPDRQSGFARQLENGVSRFEGQTETQDSRRYAFDLSPSGMGRGVSLIVELGWRLHCCRRSDNTP
jgi:hypothetical protein